MTKILMVRRILASHWLIFEPYLSFALLDYAGSMKTLSKRTSALKEAVAVVLSVVKSKKTKAAQKQLTSFTAAMEQVLAEAPNASKKPKASREKLVAADNVLSDVDEAVKSLVKAKEAWELVIELDILVQTDVKYSDKDKSAVIATHAQTIDAKLAETEHAVQAALKRAETAREEAGGKTTEKGHIITCALTDVNNVVKSHFGAVSAFVSRIKARGVFEKNIRMKISRRSQQVQQALRRLDPPSETEIKKQTLVENLKELERLTEALTTAAVASSDREDVLSQINYLLLLVDTQARANAHHDKDDPKNQQRVHLILGNLERAIRKLDALSKGKSSDQVKGKKERVHRKLARLARCAKAVSNAAQDYLVDAKKSQNTAAAAIASGDKEAAKEATRVAMEDVKKLSELAAESHGEDKDVANAASKAKQAAEALAAAEEKIEEGDKSVLDDVKAAAEAAASLNSVVQQAESRDAATEAKNGEEEDDDDEDDGIEDGMSSSSALLKIDDIPFERPAPTKDEEPSPVPAPQTTPAVVASLEPVAEPAKAPEHSAPKDHVPAAVVEVVVPNAEATAAEAVKVRDPQPEAKPEPVVKAPEPVVEAKLEPVAEKAPETVQEKPAEEKPQPAPAAAEPVQAPAPTPVAQPPAAAPAQTQPAATASSPKPEKKPETSTPRPADAVTPRASKNALAALIGRTLSRSLSGVKVAETNPVDVVIDEVAKSLDNTVAKLAADAIRVAAATLHNLATAIREQKKEDMQSCARILMTELSELVKKGRELGKTQPEDVSKDGKTDYDALNRASDSLSNYAAQIRVVVNVKANSTDKASDNDDALISLSKSLGSSVKEIASCMDKVQASK